ncbi:LysR family transcriptional regulator [Polymorphobacter multimanifer]|uniref:DNA-binding transcriptional LysR family regulator n=1 Tax=Polymorphobacter multimanifer TaxID=1070431 RepID=A0A841KZN6_9SPHN|nr:LysR family transcriptional regulator [Polymorphobacter multimanifer]MBB6225877.1 DNA-binding transcriptional LysR family regulator [Polymorphobacter multimanifer]GGI74509.1 LysR family transcriptional regulator [Polymorphobacter multimanifer]
MNLDWEKLRLFEAVAEAGSFTEAARRLHMSQPALSRQIAALEADIGAKLFHRHARGLASTHEGEQLRAATHDMQDRLERARLAIDASRDRPTGELRVTTTVSFGSTWLARQIGDFLDIYPDIAVQLMLTDDDLDLAKREADVAVRFHPPLQSELVQKPLYAIRHYLCASPEYLAKHGEPKTIADLDAHRLLAYGETAPDVLKGINWALSLGHEHAPRVPALSINNSLGVLQAVEAGAGIAALPTYLIRFSGKVQIVLPELEGPVFRTFFTYPVELRRSLRVAALRDFLAARMNAASLDIDRRALSL